MLTILFDGIAYGMLLFVLNGFAAVMFLGMLCARFRDIGPIVGTVTQLAFFISPVIWKPELLQHRQVWLVLNPVYDLMEVVRGPLLGQPPGALIWLAAVGMMRKKDHPKKTGWPTAPSQLPNHRKQASLASWEGKEKKEG